MQQKKKRIEEWKNVSRIYFAIHISQSFICNQNILFFI